MVLSIAHGGICRAATRCLIERAQGRVSSYVTSDIGAIESGRWQASHFSWKIGAMSFVNVGVLAVGVSAARPTAVQTNGTSAAATRAVSFRVAFMSNSFFRSDSASFLSWQVDTVNDSAAYVYCPAQTANPPWARPVTSRTCPHLWQAT